MKKLLIVVLLVLSLSVFALVYAYEEGPKSSSRYVYGTVAYGDGSKCASCCSIVIETHNGMSPEGCANSDGDYKIYIASEYATGVYFRGSKVWDGERSAEGGVRIDIRAK